MQSTNRPTTNLARRALLGLALLVTLTSASAWLMYAGLDQSEDPGLLHLAPVRNEMVADVRGWRRITGGAESPRTVSPTDDLVVLDRQTSATWISSSLPGRGVADLKTREGRSSRLVIAEVQIDDLTGQDQDGQTEIAAIGRLLDLGVDGVLLTRNALTASNNAKAETRLIELIGTLAAHAKVRNPDAVVGLQANSGLLESRRLRAAVDFVAVDRLLTEAGGRPRLAGDVGAQVKTLRKAQQDGVPVLASEPVEGANAKLAARRTLESYGFIAETTLAVPTASAGSAKAE